MSVNNPYETAPVGSTGPTGEDPSATSTKEHAQQAAGTASDESKHVAGVARDEAQRVASEAKSQVNQLVGEATSQVEDQSRTQRDRLVETLRSLGDDLDKMATQGEGGLAANLAREASSRARSLSSQLDGREPRDLLDDVRGFARRKPGAFLLGALAAGVVAGRLTRGAKDAGGSSDRAGDASTYGTSPGFGQTVDYGNSVDTPLTGAAVLPTAPVYSDDVDREASVQTGLPNPAGSVAGETTWADTRPGGRS